MSEEAPSESRRKNGAVTLPQQLAEVPNLRRKLCTAIAETERVAFGGENKFHHYKFTKAADVYAEVRVPFGKHGILVVPNEVEVKDLEPRQTKGEGLMFCVRVKMEYTIMDADSTETIVCNATGEGQDTSDKAIAKAKTFAYKYFLQQLLVLPTGDDPEEGETDDRTEKTLRNKAPECCPNCGKVASMVRGRGGQWTCYGSRGGCERSYSDDELDAAIKAKGTPQREPTPTARAPEAPDLPPPPEDDDQSIQDGFDAEHPVSEVPHAMEPATQAMRSQIVKLANQVHGAKSAQWLLELKKRGGNGLMDLTAIEAESVIEGLQRESMRQGVA